MFRQIVFRHTSNRAAAPPSTAGSLTAMVALAMALLLVAGPVAAQGPEEDSGPTSASAAYTGPVSSANARFIVDRYQTLLGREPETAGLDFHLARLAAGGASSRLAFTYTLLFSVEGSRGEVARAYDDLLGRTPDETGRTYWTSHLQGHGVLDLRVLLLSSGEYHNRSGGTDSAWIQALYADVLGRAADASGLAYWIGRAQAGIPRPLIAAGIYQSDEALARRAIDHYREVLARTPSIAERDGAVITIRRIGERGLRAQLLASSEAYEGFLQAAIS